MTTLGPFNRMLIRALMVSTSVVIFLAAVGEFTVRLWQETDLTYKVEKLEIIGQPRVGGALVVRESGLVKAGCQQHPARTIFREVDDPKLPGHIILEPELMSDAQIVNPVFVLSNKITPDKNGYYRVDVLVNMPIPTSVRAGKSVFAMTYDNGGCGIFHGILPISTTPKVSDEFIILPADSAAQ